MLYFGNDVGENDGDNDCGDEDSNGDDEDDDYKYGALCLYWVTR